MESQITGKGPAGSHEVRGSIPLCSTKCSQASGIVAGLFPFKTDIQPTVTDQVLGSDGAVALAVATATHLARLIKLRVIGLPAYPEVTGSLSRKAFGADLSDLNLFSDSAISSETLEGCQEAFNLTAGDVRDRVSSTSVELADI
ncbi:MAG: hypothetical protein IJH04_00895 [Eggerthellaceae bacterium]|nr:hypothetical protein [Eggerthellaceae bacterium]